MVRKCNDADFNAIFSIINDAARAYKGVIPVDRWHEPYMSEDDLRHEIANGVAFWGYEEENELIGVMGIQNVKDVTLIRHAYVRTDMQKHGIGGKLLFHLMQLTNRPVLIGTWADAFWAVRFYEKSGFTVVTREEKNRLLKKYWSIPERQIETSVVLADYKWFKGNCDAGIKSLEAIRQTIDKIDREIVRLLADRSRCVTQAARFKKTSDDVKAPARVAAILNRVRTLAAEYGVDPEIVETIFRVVIGCFISHEMKEHRK